MKWITRERPKIDRIACPWLITRFIDPAPEFLYVPIDEVLSQARALGATPYDIHSVELSHEGERCTFDTFLKLYKLEQPALHELAVIVRAADTGALHLAPQAAGLLALSLGLSVMFSDDHEMLKHGMVAYDAFYAWIVHARGETHTWHQPQMMPAFRP